MTVKHCSTCGAPMVWVTTPKGKKMPLDAEPVASGPWVIEGDPEGPDPRVRFIGDAAYTGDRYTSHFQTCPQAAQHSRRSPANP